METLQNILSQQIVQRLGWTLLHFVWQGTLVALLLAIVLQLLKKSSSILRYIVSCAAMVLIVLAPVITFQLTTVASNGLTPPINGGANQHLSEMTTLTTIELPAAENIANTEQAALPELSLKDKFVQTTESLLPHIVICWLVGVFVLSIWYLGGWTQLQRLRKQMVKPVSSRVIARLEQLSQRLGIGKAVEIFQSALVNTPTVIGHFKPIILLPATALTGLSGEQIEAILAHELAHIKRCDYLVNILQTVVEILGFYHPAVWWISGKIRTERENCCDDIAVQITGDNINYAQALAAMEEIRTLATEDTENTEINKNKLAVAATDGSLFDRICRLLGRNNTNDSKVSWLPSVIVLLFAGVLIPMALILSSCEKEQILKEGMNAKISRIDIDTATKDDVIRVFGEPEKYVWGKDKTGQLEVLDKNNLPNRYVMVYPNNFHAFIGNNHVIELRLEGPSDYVFGDGLVVGSSVEKAFSVLGKPEEIIDGKPNGFVDNIFYKNIDGKEGYGYYAVPEKDVRIWITDNKVKAIYLRRSNSSAGPDKKLRDDELPEGSIIDANGHIVDKIDYPFVNDPQVLGRWESVDYVRGIEYFKPDRQQWIWGNLFLKELIFEKDGRLISKNEKMPNGYPEKWTKGLIFYDNDQKTASKYIIKKIDGSTYMFYEWKSGDYTFRHQKPNYYVLKKVEDEANTDSEPNEVKVYEVNKSVADFGDNDFSTPEAAYATINKISGLNDNQKWAKVSVKRLADNFLKAPPNDKEPNAEWMKVLENAQILEVRIKGNYAMVFAQLPQKFSSKTIRAPIDIRSLEFEDGKWLNSGNDRVWTIEEARAKFVDAYHLQENPIKQLNGNPERQIENFKQRLEESVTVHIDKSPDGSRLTIQYAVIAICNAAGVPYQWDKSTEMTDTQCRQFIDPVNIENKVASQAIADLIGPVGLLYGVDATGVYLYKQEQDIKRQ